MYIVLASEAGLTSRSFCAFGFPYTFIRKVLETSSLTCRARFFSPLPEACGGGEEVKSMTDAMVLDCVMQVYLFLNNYLFFLSFLNYFSHPSQPVPFSPSSYHFFSIFYSFDPFPSFFCDI